MPAFDRDQFPAIKVSLWPAQDPCDLRSACIAPRFRSRTVEQGDWLRIATTDIHLPRCIGEAVAHAHEGNFSFHHDEEGYFLRGEWRRDA